MTRRFVPDAGEIVWLELDPSGGTRAGRTHPGDGSQPRVLQCQGSDALTGKEGGIVLTDQVKSLDWRARRVRRKGVASVSELAEVRAKLRVLIG